MKTVLLAAALASFALVPGRATSVTLSSSPLGRDVVDVASAALENGDLVLIGTFLNPLALELAPVIDLQAEGGWTPFGSALSIGSVIGHPGKLVGTSSDTTASADFFNGRKIYLWIFNAPSVEQATEWGIFTASDASPAWIFPANGGGIGDLLTLDADSPQLSAVNGLGSVSNAHLQLVHAVPEPGAPALLALGAAFLAWHMRRRPFSHPCSRPDSIGKFLPPTAES